MTGTHPGCDRGRFESECQLHMMQHTCSLKPKTHSRRDEKCKLDVGMCKQGYSCMNYGCLGIRSKNKRTLVAVMHFIRHMSFQELGPLTDVVGLTDLKSGILLHEWCAPTQLIRNTKYPALCYFKVSGCPSVICPSQMPQGSDILVL